MPHGVVVLVADLDGDGLARRAYRQVVEEGGVHGWVTRALPRGDRVFYGVSDMLGARIVALAVGADGVVKTGEYTLKDIDADERIETVWREESKFSLFHKYGLWAVMRDQYIYVTDIDGLTVVDAADPAALKRVAHLGLNQYRRRHYSYGNGWSPESYIDGGTLYTMRRWPLELVEVDIGDPAAPREASTYSFRNRRGSLAVQGGWVYGPGARRVFAGSGGIVRSRLTASRGTRQREFLETPAVEQLRREREDLPAGDWLWAEDGPLPVFHNGHIFAVMGGSLAVFKDDQAQAAKTPVLAAR